MDAQQHTLPAGYAAFAEAFKYGGRLKADCDAFGKPLESEIGSILTAEEIAADSARELSFFLDSFDEEDMDAAEKEGRLKTLVCFAADGASNPFFMDFSRSPSRPSVLYWDDAELVLRTPADNIEDFFALFEPED